MRFRDQRQSPPPFHSVGFIDRRRGIKRAQSTIALGHGGKHSRLGFIRSEKRGTCVTQSVIRFDSLIEERSGKCKFKATFKKRAGVLSLTLLTVASEK